MATGASAATPFASGVDQTTPLTSNVSDRSPEQQSLLSHQNLKAESIQLSSIQEEYVSDGGVVGPIEEHVNVGDVLKEQVKDGDVGACLSLSPVNLDLDFAAANPPNKSRLDSSPEEDDDCVFIDGAPKCPVAPNQSLSIYSLSDA
jgi:hypothetical protein